MLVRQTGRRWRAWLALWIVVTGTCVGVGAADDPPATKSEKEPPKSAPAAKGEKEDKNSKSDKNSKNKKAASSDKDDLQVTEEDYELLRLFVDTLDQIQRNYVKDVSRRELMEAAIRGMTAKLDQHSNYIPPDEVEGFRGSVESEFGGIGLQVGVTNGRLIVISPIVGTPAYRAGIVAGDWISAVDGNPTGDLSLDEAVKRMKGKAGSTVKLTVVHARDGKSEELSLQREVVRVDTVLGDHRNDDDSWNFLVDEPRKIAYIRITSFSRNTTADLKKALKTLEKQEMKALVLDLRFNPGGLLSSAIEVSDLFVEEGRIVSTAGRNVDEQVAYARKAGTYSGFPMVVLVNRFSASASEIVSACLQDHQRAVIVGERTWGKGSVQNIIELEGGKSALKLTTASYQRPNGKNIHRFEGASEEDEWGVRPNEGYDLRLSGEELGQLIEDRRRRDIVQKKDDAPEEKPADVPAPKFVDRQLEKGLEYLRGKLEAPAK